MRTNWRSLTVDAVDYELVRVHGGPPEAELGDFRDAYFSREPRWRLVSGYLMLADLSPDPWIERASSGSAGTERGHLGIHSHGAPCARLAVESGAVQVEFIGDWRREHCIVRGGTVALRLERGNWREEGGRLIAGGGEPWLFTIVHGPAPVKIENRLALLAGLETVGGRRG